MMAGATLFSSMSSGHVHQRDNGETTGWYPRDCCGNGDCRPATEVQQVGAGLWLKAADGTTVFHSTGDHARASQDRHWHFCVSYDHDAQAYVVRCVFAPQMNSAPRPSSTASSLMPSAFSLARRYAAPSAQSKPSSRKRELGVPNTSLAAVRDSVAGTSRTLRTERSVGLLCGVKRTFPD